MVVGKAFAVTLKYSFSDDVCLFSNFGLVCLRSDVIAVVVAHHINRLVQKIVTKMALSKF